MNDSKQIKDIIYDVDDLILDVDNFCDFLEVLGIGFYNDHADNKVMEVASIASITQYIENVIKKKLVNILEMLRDLRYR